MRTYPGGEVEYDENDVRGVIGAEITATSLRKVAKRIGMSPAYLSDIMRNRRAISESVAGYFGFDREIYTEIIFRKKP